MKLHIGCGDVNFGKEWIHIDKDKKKFVQFENIYNLPFDDKSIEHIYSSYMVQSLSKDEILSFFTECKRVLKKGATIRISVPDFFLVSDKYIKSKMKIDDANFFLINDTKVLLDFLNLQKLLIQCGFYGVRRLDLDKYPPEKKDSSCILFNGENITLSVEAYG